MRLMLACSIALAALLAAGCTEKTEEPKPPASEQAKQPPAKDETPDKVQKLMDSAREKYKASGDPHDAIEDLTRALDLKPAGEQEAEVRKRLADACTLYARRLAHQKKYDEAMTFFKRAWEADPQNAFAHMEYGVTLYEMGKSNEALEAYDKTIELKPDYHQAYNARGLIKLDEGRNEEAEKDFDKALEIQPDHVWSLVNKGIVLDRAGKTDEALKLFDKAIRLDPNNGLAYSKRGWAHLQKGSYHKAVVDCTRAIKLAADLDIAYINRASAYAMQGIMHLAVADYHTFLDHFPNHPRADEIRKWLDENEKGRKDGGIRSH